MKNQRFWGCKVSSERSQSDSPSGRSNVRNDPKVRWREGLQLNFSGKSLEIMELICTFAGLNGL